jgi:hypothetical protein
MSLLATISLPTSPFPPVAVGFMGLGTGYLIYGPQELFGFPKRDASVDFGVGMWGIWMPGFLQFLTGTYIFLGLTLFGTFTDPGLYMAGLAFTAYGVHWFAIGWNRLLPYRNRHIPDVPHVRHRAGRRVQVHAAGGVRLAP